MKHAGKAAQAALRLMFWTLVLLLALIAAGVIAKFLGGVILSVIGLLVGLWVLFVLFTFYFFRDPEPAAPSDANAIVAPGQGKVDVIDETTEAEFMGGPCRRVSIFLSVIDVHVQRAPVTGKIVHLKHKPGQFLSATRSDCAEFNENVLLGFIPLGRLQERVGLRLIAGLIARRIIVWSELDEIVQRSERVSLIQFGSRCDLYLPLTAKIRVQLGDKVKAGETVVATFE